MDKQRLSVGFADMANFPRAAEVVGFPAVLEVLQEAFKGAGDIIVGHGGRIHKYIGDRIMFTFTDPGQVVLAANETAALRWEVDGLILRYHVSVATGEVFVGKMGHTSHMMDDVVGEAVNRAAIMVKEAQKSETGVALCEETQKQA